MLLRLDKLAYSSFFWPVWQLLIVSLCGEFTISVVYFDLTAQLISQIVSHTHFGWITSLFLLFQSGNLCEKINKGADQCDRSYCACPLAQPAERRLPNFSHQQQEFWNQAFVKSTKLCGYGFSFYYNQSSSEESRIEDFLPATVYHC